MKNPNDIIDYRNVKSVGDLEFQYSKQIKENKQKESKQTRH